MRKKIVIFKYYFDETFASFKTYSERTLKLITQLIFAHFEFDFYVRIVNLKTLVDDLVSLSQLRHIV